MQSKSIDYYKKKIITNVPDLIAMLPNRPLEPVITAVVPLSSIAGL